MQYCPMFKRVVKWGMMEQRASASLQLGSFASYWPCWSIVAVAVGAEDHAPVIDQNIHLGWVQIATIDRNPSYLGLHEETISSHHCRLSFHADRRQGKRVRLACRRVCRIVVIAP